MVGKRGERVFIDSTRMLATNVASVLGAAEPGGRVSAL